MTSKVTTYASVILASYGGCTRVTIIATEKVL